MDTAGDGFLARFDAPASAVRAAVAAVGAMTPLGIELRAGLHTSEVELHGDQIAGVGVHLAARVMAEADPGQVLVSSTVREVMAGSELGFVDLGVCHLKGFAEPWRLFALDPATVLGSEAEPVVWEPLAQVRDGLRARFPGLLSVSPAFVGRAEELQLLQATRVRAAGGEPAVVLVGGEAGVGKTRLVGELTAWCVADGIRVLAGGCVPVGGGGLPYAPIVEALRPLPEEFGVDTMRELAGPAWRELARMLPSLGEFETGPPGQVAQPWLFELLLGLLGRLSEQTSVVLVVEDLHWADQSTRDLLTFLVRNLRHERVLLVVTYRSDEPRTEGLGPWLAELDRAGPVQRLELPRLDRAETAAQLTGILGAPPSADLVDGVFARSEGNPFFTEELLAVVRAGSRELPATLRDLLRGRVAGELAGRLGPARWRQLGSRSGLAELAIWEGRYDDGRAILDQTLSELARLDPAEGEEKPLDTAEICALGLRVEADCADLARAARSAAAVQQAHRRAEPLLATLPALTGPAADPRDAWTPCHAALGEAEWSRLQGRPDSQAWQRAAEHWERLELRYRAAYARFRQAEALLAARAPRAQIQPVLQAAHRTAVALGAGPLRGEIELLAGRGRLGLEQPVAAVAAPDPLSSPAAPLGLTRREAEVLQLVAAGRTNRQIGQALYITPKTASVHVSRILAKLGVAGRGEAAAIAHRLGLDKQ